MASFQVGSAANEIISVGIEEMSSSSLDGTYYSKALTGIATIATDGTYVGGTAAVTVTLDGGDEKVLSFELKAGDDAASATAKMAAAVNDANLGVSIQKNDSDAWAVITKSNKDGDGPAVTEIELTTEPAGLTAPAATEIAAGD